jgi:acetyl-CoA carboxylase biotin carboxylase subunit
MKNISKVLVANRGEIAIRVFKTCKEMGIGTVAVFSDADRDSLFVKLADEAVAIGGKQPGESYLVQDKIIAAAKATGADAIHPGYGFLSENESFAARCREEGIIFIGPNPEAIAAMGSKIRAKEIVAKKGVPTIPGYNGKKQDNDVLFKEAVKIGFPVLLKASAGGGGKGMRVVRKKTELKGAIEAAKREALNAFGDDAMLIEKYFDSSRHVEFQIFGDQHGNAIHLFERECSIQRRHQKVIEESPSPVLDDKLRQKMGEAAVNAAKAINYDNAGTVEFIVAEDGSFFFLEVNTRLQVEHPVTEMVTGLDLVRWQILVAMGQPLPLSQEQVKQEGHAIEVRLYAEDPGNNFLPVSGTIQTWEPATLPGLRYDTGIASGSVIDVFYDPMIAKVIAHASTRAEAIAKMQKALQETVVSGFVTNKNFLVAILQHDDFKAGKFDTHFLDKVFQYAGEKYPQHTLDLLTVVLQVARFHARNSQRKMAAQVPAGWRNNFYQPQLEKYAIHGFEFDVQYRNRQGTLEISFAEKNFTAKLLEVSGQWHTMEIDGIRRRFHISHAGQQYFVQAPVLGQLTFTVPHRYPEPAEEVVKGGYAAPMPGEITKVLVQPGDKVKSGQPLLIIVSMKMENTIEADEDGEVEEVYVQEKAFVEAGTLMLKMIDK